MSPFARRSLLALLALILFAAGIAAWRAAGAPTLEQRYRLQTVEKGDIVQSVSANGTLNPIVLVNVGTQVSGTVTKLYVDFNDKVVKGQPLLELDPSLLAAQARQSAANAINIETSLRLARATEARLRALFAQDYVSRQDLDQAVQARQSAEAQLAQAKAAADKDRVNLGYAVIRSPVSGIVVDRVVDLGQTVAASLQTPTLIKIAQDLSEMRIDSSFSEADVGKIQPGQPVRFTVDAFPERAFTGQVQQIRMNATVTQNVVTYNVRISLENPEQILLPGMTAYVNIAVARRDGVLTAPNAALRFRPADIGAKDGEKNNEATERDASRAAGEARRPGRRPESSAGTVYVIDGKRLKAVAVQTGITDNRHTEIVGGALQAGDRVVVGDNPAAASKPSSLGVRLF